MDMFRKLMSWYDAKKDSSSHFVAFSSLHSKTIKWNSFKERKQSFTIFPHNPHQ
jgi:hypothetical protein